MDTSEGMDKNKSRVSVGIGSIKRGSLGQEDNRRRGPKKEDTMDKIPR